MAPAFTSWDRCVAASLHAAQLTWVQLALVAGVPSFIYCVSFGILKGRVQLARLCASPPRSCCRQRQRPRWHAGVVCTESRRLPSASIYSSDGASHWSPVLVLLLGQDSDHPCEFLSLSSALPWRRALPCDPVNQRKNPSDPSHSDR